MHGVTATYVCSGDLVVGRGRWDDDDDDDDDDDVRRWAEVEKGKEEDEEVGFRLSNIRDGKLSDLHEYVHVIMTCNNDLALKSVDYSVSIN